MCSSPTVDKRRCESRFWILYEWGCPRPCSTVVFQMNETHRKLLATRKRARIARQPAPTGGTPRWSECRPVRHKSPLFLHWLLQPISFIVCCLLLLPLFSLFHQTPTPPHLSPSNRRFHLLLLTPPPTFPWAQSLWILSDCPIQVLNDLFSHVQWTFPWSFYVSRKWIFRTVVAMIKSSANGEAVPVSRCWQMFLGSNTPAPSSEDQTWSGLVLSRCLICHWSTTGLTTANR